MVADFLSVRNIYQDVLCDVTFLLLCGQVVLEDDY
jgi:hypothetical protein